MTEFEIEQALKPLFSFTMQERDEAEDEKRIREDAESEAECLD